MFLFINLSGVYFPHIFILTFVKNLFVAIAFGARIFSYCLFQWSVLNWGKNKFKFAAAFTWNNLQIKLQLRELVSLDVFKVILNNLEMETLGCRCFDLCIDILLLVEI